MHDADPESRVESVPNCMCLGILTERAQPSTFVSEHLTKKDPTGRPSKTSVAISLQIDENRIIAYVLDVFLLMFLMLKLKKRGEFQFETLVLGHFQGIFEKINKKPKTLKQAKNNNFKNQMGKQIKICQSPDKDQGPILIRLSSKVFSLENHLLEK